MILQRESIAVYFELALTKEILSKLVCINWKETHQFSGSHDIAYYLLIKCERISSGYILRSLQVQSVISG